MRIKPKVTLETTSKRPIGELLKIEKDRLENPQTVFFCFNNSLTNCPFSHQGKKYLQNQDRWHPIHKIPVLRLMMKSTHPDQAASASANQGNEKERRFPDTPSFFDGSAFVNAHHGKTDQVDDCQI